MRKELWFFDKILSQKEPRVKYGFRIKKKIFSGKSDFQKIDILDTYQFGRTLFLDRVIQLSQTDEFIYHEMISHLPLFSHPNPKKILIIGGGDGGVLREVLLHPVEEVYLVDIDKKVIEISKKYLSFVSKGAFENKRAKMIIGDGLKFIKKFKNYFDIVISDATEPVGPSMALYQIKFYQDVFSVLKKDGIMITQSGNFTFEFYLIKRVFKILKKIFPFVKIYRFMVPSFESEFCLILASKKINLDKISLKELKERYKKVVSKSPKRFRKLKYYSPEIHLASGVLPKFYQVK